MRAHAGLRRRGHGDERHRLGGRRRAQDRVARRLHCDLVKYGRCPDPGKMPGPRSALHLDGDGPPVQALAGEEAWQIVAVREPELAHRAGRAAHVALRERAHRLALDVVELRRDRDGLDLPAARLERHVHERLADELARRDLDQRHRSTERHSEDRHRLGREPQARSELRERRDRGLHRARA
jgi:hypothetical protein